MLVPVTKAWPGLVEVQEIGLGVKEIKHYREN